MNKKRKRQCTLRQLEKMLRINTIITALNLLVWVIYFMYAGISAEINYFKVCNYFMVAVLVIWGFLMCFLDLYFRWKEQ